MNVSPGGIPGNETPGTPSISNGSRMPCQWIDVGSSSSLWTRSVTTSPSRNRSSGAGTLPPTVTAIPCRPSMPMAVRATTRSNSRTAVAWAPRPTGSLAQAGNRPCTAASALADAVARKSSLRVMLILDSRNVIPLPVPPRRRKRASAHAAPARTSAATHAYRGNQMRRTRDRCGGDRALSSGGLHPPAGGQASDTAAGVSVPSAGTAAGA